MKKLLAYHGKPELKSQVIADMRADIEDERLVSGKYWDDYKGCHVGCVVMARTGIQNDKYEDWHAQYEEAIGVPRDLARLFDGLFESLDNGKRQQFSLDVLEAMPVSADLSDVPRQWLIWLMNDVRQYVGDDESVLLCIDDVISLLGGNCQNAARWAAAWAAANAAAWAAANAAAGDAANAAAWAAAWAATWDAAWDAATDTPWEAFSAATWDAAWDAAWDTPWEAFSAATWDAARETQTDKLLELLRHAPVVSAESQERSK